MLPSKSQASYTGVPTGLNDLLLTNSLWCTGLSVTSEIESLLFGLSGIPYSGEVVPCCGMPKESSGAVQ